MAVWGCYPREATKTAVGTSLEENQQRERQSGVQESVSWRQHAYQRITKSAPLWAYYGGEWWLTACVVCCQRAPAWRIWTQRESWRECSVLHLAQRWRHSSLTRSETKSAITAKISACTPVPLLWDVPFHQDVMSTFSPVTASEVHRVLTKMPCKLSPLDFVPTSLLKACSGAFSFILQFVIQAWVQLPVRV